MLIVTRQRVRSGWYLLSCCELWVQRERRWYLSKALSRCWQRHCTHRLVVRFICGGIPLPPPHCVHQQQQGAVICCVVWLAHQAAATVCTGAVYNLHTPAPQPLTQSKVRNTSLHSLTLTHSSLDTRTLATTAAASFVRTLKTSPAAYVCQNTDIKGRLTSLSVCAVCIWSLPSHLLFWIRRNFSLD